MSDAFSHDLISNAKKHIQFLIDAHNERCKLYSTTTSTTTTKPATICNKQELLENLIDGESLRRYIKLWLPMVADLTKSDTTTTNPLPLIVSLYPPPDIAWMWHCHRLAPRQYYEYCHTTFGRTIEACPPFSINLLTRPSEVGDRTISLWNERYPSESFFLDSDKISSSILSMTDNSENYEMCNLDLLGSVQRQDKFLWHVSGNQYTDDEFLSNGLDNYYKFIQLFPIAKKQSIVLVPTFQIDLMWHTHILSSINLYNKDCLNIINMTIYHDDSYTDRSEGSVLDNSYKATQNIWLQEYGVSYVVDGGMYCGEPPKEYYTVNWLTYCKDHHDTQPIEYNDNSMESNSTSTGELSLPKNWATIYDRTSDGRPAFIREKSKGEALYSAPYKKNYIFGRKGKKTGYFHIETIEANKILLKRIKQQLINADNDLAMKQCYCGLLGTTTEEEKRILELEQCQKLLRERIKASVPSGRTKTNVIGTTKVSDSDGHWIYPTILYNYAGGLCGGAVYSETTSAGGSGYYTGGGACSTGGGGCSTGGGCGAGGGCGGGGCGGGGCGGGGCGGGGCGGGGCGGGGCGGGGCGGGGCGGG